MVLESTTSAQIQENSPRFCSHEGLTGPKTGQVSVKPGTRIDHLQPKPGIKTRQVSTRPGTRINQTVRVPVSRSTIPTTEGDIFTVQLWHSKVTELQLVDSCLIVALQGFKGTGLEIFHILGTLLAVKSTRRIGYAGPNTEKRNRNRRYRQNTI